MVLASVAPAIARRGRSVPSRLLLAWVALLRVAALLLVPGLLTIALLLRRAGRVLVIG